MNRRAETTILSRGRAETPLGRLTLAGTIKGGHGVNPTPPWRVFGSYAAVYLLAGKGWYRDANGYAQRVGAGDLMLVFPELPHTYGPDPGATWDEFYLVFEGPVFDLWRASGLLDPRRPVHHLEAVDEWLDRLRGVVGETSGGSLPERSLAVCRFLSLLTEMLTVNASPEAEVAEGDRLTQARIALESNLGNEINLVTVAAQAGLSYESFRKRFVQQTGTSPAHYRAERRLEAARDLLRYTQMTSRQIADALGFADEFYFSKRFRHRFGESPRSFRQGLRIA